MAGIGQIVAQRAGRAGRVAELADVVRKAAPPPPPAPAPPPPPTAAGRRHPMQDQWDRRVRDFQVRSGSLPPLPEGYVRLFRGGYVPKDSPPRLPDDVINGPFGQKMTRRQYDATKGPAHANPLDAEGRWYTDAADQMDFYVRENDTDPVYYLDVPAEYAAKHNVKNTPFLKNSRNPDREFVLPTEAANSATRLLEGLKVQ